MLNVLFLHVGAFSRKDKTFLFLFIAVSLIVGQVGVWASLFLTLQSGKMVSDAWTQSLASATMYTYSISLVVSSVAMIGSEFIDASRSEKKLDFFERKIIWSILAGVVVILQAPLAGALLSNPVLPEAHANYSIEIIFWVLSMVIALQLYTLYRIPFIPQHYAAERTKQVDQLNQGAESQHETSFGEKV